MSRRRTGKSNGDRTANLLGALAVEISEQIAGAMKQHPNQTDSSAAALNLIAAFEGCSNSQLSAALRLSHSATVRLVDKLEALGFVESGAGADKRSVALRVTEQGRAHARAAVDCRSDALRGIVRHLSAGQQAQLSGIASTLLEALVRAPIDAGHICRLCDAGACPHDCCPTHQRAVELMAMEPDSGVRH